MFVKIFQASSDDGMGKKSNFVEFSTQSFLKFVLVWLAREEQNILTYTCLHTLMQTHLSANRSARVLS